MPSSSNSVADFPRLFSCAYRYNVANGFMAGNHRARVYQGNDPSPPRVRTYKGFPNDPTCTLASLWHTPVARTLMRISPSRGSFSSTSSKVRGSLAFLKTAVLKVLGRAGDMLRDELNSVDRWTIVVWTVSRGPTRWDPSYLKDGGVSGSGGPALYLMLS